MPLADTLHVHIGKAKASGDTIKAPLTRAEAPPIIGIGAPRIYDRAALFATGALTLSDLLGRVPGLTEFTAGWLGAPATVASLGNLRRVRVFLDGLEIDPLDPRARGVSAPNDLPIHALEELRIEQAVDEVRLYARSWRVDRTTPYTRADIGTGDQNTNAYRAYFGRRFSGGEAFQLSAEQYNTQPERALPSSDALNLMLRAGTTRGPWSGDLFIERSDRNRAPWTGRSTESVDTIAGAESQRTTRYARIGNGDPDRGRWIQFLASDERYRLSPRQSNAFSLTTPVADSTTIPDSVIALRQYLLTGGTRYGPFRVSGAERIRNGGGRTSFSPSARGAVETSLLNASLFAEGESPVNPTRYEGTLRFTPLSRIALVGSATHTALGLFERLYGDSVSGGTLTETGLLLPGLRYFFPGYDSAEVARYVTGPTNNFRAEAGVRVRDLWISAGMLKRGATTLLPPSELVSDSGRGTSVRLESAATARTLALRGRLYRAVNVDAWGIAWNDTSGFYRPRYQTRSELYIQTNLLDRFPKGNFGLLASLAHEYRSTVRFPFGADSVLTTPGFRALAFRLEIRVQTAVVSYQFRNLLQQSYQEIPGILMPRQTQFYGIRWDFWD